MHSIFELSPRDPSTSLRMTERSHWLGKMFVSASRKVGNSNSKPFSRKRFGTPRWLTRARLASVPINHEPMRAANSGTGGLHGRCSARRNSRMNSALGTGFGELALKVPVSS